jgi:hypothetical protein
MIVIAYYSNDGYRNMVYRLAGICDSWGIRFRAYNRAWLERQPEYQPNRAILDVARGNGYWAWKPLIMLDALKQDPEVIYLDSSVVPISKEALRYMPENTTGITAIASDFDHCDWTKPECFRIMHCTTMKYLMAKQVWAGVVCATLDGKPILKEWKKFCLVQEAVADDITFRNHRHDQSILTNLLIKYNKIPLVAFPGTFEDVLDYGGTYKRPQNFEEA